MKLEPQIADFIKRADEISSGSTSISVSDQRREYDDYCSYYSPPLPAGVISTDEIIITSSWNVPTRWYRYTESHSRVCVIYFHGGGFILGGLNSHDFLCARLCRDSGCHVISVDYRLAPEHRFPAAFEDCFNVLQIIQNESQHHGIDSNKVFLCGDSAGGNLTAAVALANRNRGGPHLAGQIMIYPVLAADTGLPAYSECRDAPMLTTTQTEFYMEMYLGEGEHNAYSAPLLSDDLGDLPPALLLPVEYDPLRDDACAYHEGLSAANVDSTLYLGKGLVHGCMRALDSSPGVQTMYNEILTFMDNVIKGLEN